MMDMQSAREHGPRSSHFRMNNVDCRGHLGIQDHAIYTLGVYDRRSKSLKYGVGFDRRRSFWPVVPVTNNRIDRTLSQAGESKNKPSIGWASQCWLVRRSPNPPELQSACLVRPKGMDPRTIKT